MRHLPNEQTVLANEAKNKFRKFSKLTICEPCDCGSNIRHNNGGNYHQIIELKREYRKEYVKYDSTCELVAPAEWQLCEDWQSVIAQHADWL